MILNIKEKSEPLSRYSREKFPLYLKEMEF
jgi:hypothetical protein